MQLVHTWFNKNKILLGSSTAIAILAIPVTLALPKGQNIYNSDITTMDTSYFGSRVCESKINLQAFIFKKFSEEYPQLTLASACYTC